MLTQPAYVISAPSGTGKESVIAQVLMAERRMRLAPSWTTRERRKGDGRKYTFVTKEDFENAIASGKFLEWKPVVDHFYGTCLQGIPSDVELIIEIDYKGALELKTRYPDLVHTVFLLPPSFEELEKRLRGRKTESPEQVAKRLALAPTEIKHADQFDSWIENKEVEAAAALLRLLIMTQRNKMKQSPVFRNLALLDRVRSTFAPVTASI